jgi:hypothetical protein
MRAVFLENAEGEQAGAFRLLNALAEIGGGELFPFGGEFGLGAEGGGGEENGGERDASSANHRASKGEGILPPSAQIGTIESNEGDPGRRREVALAAQVGMFQALVKTIPTISWEKEFHALWYSLVMCPRDSLTRLREDETSGGPPTFQRLELCHPICGKMRMIFAEKSTRLHDKRR